MGSILTLISLPLTNLVNNLTQINGSINGKWFVFIKLLTQLWWKRFWERGRLELHDKRVTRDARAVGLLPIDSEWLFESPSNNKYEDIFIYGVNSDGQYIILYIKSRPIDSKGNIKTLVNFTIKDSDGSIYRLYEDSKILYAFSKRVVEYRIAGLRLEILNPFRRIRIKFRGYLKKNNTNNLVYARIRLLWLSLSNVFDFQRNHDNCFLAKELSRISRGDPVFEDRFEQFGQIKGTIQFESAPQHDIYLWGSRCKKYYPKQRNQKKSITRVFGYTRKGIGFHLGVVKTKSDEISASPLIYRYGYCFWRLGSVKAIEDITLSANEFDGLVSDNRIKFEFRALHRKFNVDIDNEAVAVGSVWIKKLKVNDDIGYCVIERHEENEIDKQLTDSKPYLNYCDSLVIAFDNESAQRVDLSGGKGSSLAKLYALSQKNESFSVPKGVIVTTNSYELLLKNSVLNAEIDCLQKLVCSPKRDNLKNECFRVCELISNAELENTIKEEIRDKLISTFGNDYGDLLFAVRSSASSEDSAEMSAAGQMTTYLGVVGLENIYKSVMKCWASQFEFVSVEYKRGYGQLINSPMAVVIQLMVNCDSAGVMFTCHPNTGDERNIIINANFGLGESVVSAASEPDNITLSVKVEDNCCVKPRKVDQIESKQIGAKKKIIKLSKTGGTIEEDGIDQNNDCCVDDSLLIKLGEIALKIHCHYGHACDIEWGIKDGSIYLLQSRPVTNLDNSFTEFELMHEFDTGHHSEIDINTRSHWGENFPGSQSWLLLSFAMKSWDIFNSRFYNKELNPYVITLGGFFFNQKFMSFRAAPNNLFTKKDPNNKLSRSILISFFGHDVDDNDVWDVCAEMAESEPPKCLTEKIMDAFGFLSILLTSNYRFRKTREKYLQEFDLTRDKDFKSAKELFEHICANYEGNHITINRHILCTFSSLLKNSFLMKFLSELSESDAQLDCDYAILLSSCTEVVSAEVPNQLREIARAIEDRNKFISLSDSEALDFLQSRANQASDKFVNFMAKHGYRGYKEFDYMSARWSDDPIPLIKTIKSLLIGGENSLKVKPEKSMDELLDSIKTKLSRKTRFLLRYILLPICKTGVGVREQTKCLMVWAYNKYRLAFQLLAIKMVAEGRIPDEETIYYLSIDEIEALFRERNPLLLAKARQRKRIFPKMNAYKFDEFVKGPKMVPRNVTNELTANANDKNLIRMSGTSACSGKVTARVCVAEDISEADNIRPGDILITYGTDIGWSPYFPLISGIITEIGGTMSHGAVIAREYGIPSVIAVDGVCRAFKTGDTVLLDAEKGEIIKLNKSD